MAYYNSTNAATQSQGMNEKDEEEEKKNSLQPVSLTQGSTAGTSSGATTAPVGQAQPKAQAKSATSGMGPGFSAFTKANMGVAQNRLNQAASQNVTQQGQAAKTGINQATSQFNQRADQGTLANRDKATQDVASAIAAIRNPQTQQPQQAEGQQAPAAPTPAQPTQEQTSRFQEIINAKYQGPESLRQSGLYDLASKRVQKAQNTLNQTQTAGGREEMLRNMFQKQGNYTQGLNKLDSSLLNSSQSGVQGLQDAAKAQGNLGQSLDQAQLNSVNLAGNRAKEIAGIRDQSRELFKTERTAEENATEQRIDSLVKTPVMDANGQPVLKQDGTPMTEWDRLPEHFRASLANKAQGAKTVQSEAIQQAESAIAPQKQQLQQSQAKLNDLNSQRAKIQDQLSLSKELAGFVDSRNKAKFQKSLIDMQNQLNALDSTIGAENQIAQSIQSTPEYKQYQQSVQNANNMNMNQWMLSPEEAAILGVSSGEGLYNTQASDIRTTQAERDRIVSKDEFARQQALSQLAGLDQSNTLQKDLRYTDANKAGTQTLNDSLDTGAFRNLLNEAQNSFKESAEGANLTGSGSKKVSRGNAFGKKTKTYYADVQGNVADMLRSAGIDVSKMEPSQAQSILGDQELTQRLFSERGMPLTNQAPLNNKQALESYLGGTNTSRDQETNIGGSATEGAIAGAGVGSVVPVIGTTAGAMAGAAIGGNTMDQLQAQSDVLKELEEKYGIKGAGAIGQGVQDVRNVAGSAVTGIGNIFGGSLGSAIGSIGSAVGGINAGDMKAFGDSVAKDHAIADLQNKYAAYLQGQGFENRTNIADTDSTRTRTAALQALLNRKG